MTTRPKFHTHTHCSERCVGSYLSLILGFLVCYISVVCYVVPGQSYRQLKASESCDHDDEDDVAIAQRILELTHVRRLSHLSEDNKTFMILGTY